MVPVGLTGWWLAGAMLILPKDHWTSHNGADFKVDKLDLSQWLTWMILLIIDEQASVSFTNARGMDSLIFDSLH